MFGLAGLGFSAANLILARALTPADFALITLVISLTNIGYPLGPLGLDSLTVRHDLRADPALLRRGLATSTATALVVSGVGYLVYGIDPVLLGLAGTAMIAGGVSKLAAAKYQSLKRFHVSVLLSQGNNYFFLVAAIVTALFAVEGGRVTLAIVSLGHLLAAVWGWRVLLASADGARGSTTLRWGEALSLAGMAGASLVLPQLERLITPKVLSLEELAQFGVIAAIVIGPFRVLQMGVGRTMVPRLREADSPRARRRLLVKEAGIVGGFVAAGALLLWYLTNPVARWLAGPEYVFSHALIAATLFSGLVKVIRGFVNATILALGTTRQLAIWNRLGWVTVLAAGGGAIVGSRWGLPGLVYGASAAVLVSVALGGVMLAPHLSDPARRSPR